MATEYYIRQPDSETARGPFTIDKLQSLVEASQLNRETLYYDEDKEAWTPIDGNEELRSKIFPEKRKLALRPKTADELNLLNQPEDDGTPPVQVEQMLAAAEGDTDETKHFRQKEEMMQRAATLSIPVIAILLLISALSNIIPAWEIINQFVADREPGLLIDNPLVVVGLLDLFFAVCVFLGATEVYRLLRFRFALGAGYFGYTYWVYFMNFGGQENLYAVYATAAASLGVFVCTMTLHLYTMFFFAMVGLAGASAFAYFTYVYKFFLE